MKGKKVKLNFIQQAFSPFGRKGQQDTLVWLGDMLKGIAEILLVCAILFSVIAIVWKGAQTPQDKDFKRILDAQEVLIENYQDGKAVIGAKFTVPIVTEDQLPIIYYPQGSTGAPIKCKGKTCICMYPVVNQQKKETCKTIDIKGKCSDNACGELCAGDYAQFTVTKGNAVNIQIQCNEGKGMQLMVNKA